MLILTRKVGEIIRIGDNVIIHNLGCRGNESRIGITAPKSVSIDRQEIYEKKLSKNANSELTDLNQSEKPIQNPIDCKAQSNLKSDTKITIKKKRISNPANQSHQKINIEGTLA